jgi:transcription antitermination factor NusG
MIDWFVLNTKPKKEFHVEKIFTEAGFVVYNPKYSKDGRVVPFFPGYEFIQFEFPEQYKLVKYTRGVKKIIGSQEGPIPIQEYIIQQIKAREVGGLIEFDKYGEEPEVGDEIEVMEGPMKGLRGIFKEELSGKDRILILLNYVSYQGRIVLEKKKLRKIKR